MTDPTPATPAAAAPERSVLTRSAPWALLFVVALFVADGRVLRLGGGQLLAGVLVALSLIGLLLIDVTARGRSASTAAKVVKIVVLVAVAAIVVSFGLRMKHAWGAPPLREVTTDTADPPDFSELVVLRKQAGAKTPPEYLPEIVSGQRKIDAAQAQREAYPDIQSARLTMSPAQAFAAAEHAARSLGWHIVASAPAEGRIEATHAAVWLGMVDDIALRVRADGAGSRVDVRSKSRADMPDQGVNAERVRTYLAKLSSAKPGA